MTEICSNANFKIIQKAQIFQLEFTYPSPILCHSLVKTKLLRAATIVDDYKQIVFKASSVQVLNDKKKRMSEVAAMVTTLSVQLKYMIDELGATFIGFNTENVIVIDSDRFVFLDAELINNIGENGSIMISKPFVDTDFFFSPEMKQVTKLPTSLHYKTCYFSLGCLLLYSLFGKERFDEGKERYNYKGQNTYNNTKLHCLISRCLVEDPEKRTIIFI